MDREKLLERLKAILNRTTENGCTEAEAAQAMAMAQKLMIEHNLDMAELHAATGTQEEYTEEDAGFAVSRWSLERELAAGICKKFFLVECYKRIRVSEETGYKRRVNMIFFGTKENIDAARFVFTSLIEAFDRLWHEYRKSKPGVPVRDRRMFVAGVASGFRRKLESERKSVNASRTGTEIVITGRERALQENFAKAHPDMPGPQPMSPLNGSESSFQDGFKEGMRLNLARPISNDRNRPSLPSQ